MNDLTNTALADASEVRDLRGVSLAELPADPATGAVVARVTSEPSKAPAFAVGAFNSYI